MKIISAAAILSLFFTAGAVAASTVETSGDYVLVAAARDLKKGGGGGSSSSGGKRPSTTSSGSGGSSRSAPKGGNYVNGGLGSQYRSTSDSTRGSALGSCCRYMCCTSGYQAGHRRYWYRGYRPTEEEGLVLETAFQNASLAMTELALFNETADLQTADCALVLEPGDEDTGLGGLLVNRSIASEAALGNFTSTTVRLHLTDLSTRLNAFEWDDEVDLHTDLRAWFLDYNALQPCLDELSDHSDEHASHVLAVRQEVQDAEDMANAWEQRLASSTSIRMWKMAGALASIVGIFLSL